MGIYTGSCGSPTFVACGEDINLAGQNYRARVNLQTTTGTVYYVMVDGFDNVSWNPNQVLSEGNFCLGVTRIDQVSVNEVSNTQSFSLYPNPSNGQFVIESNNEINRVEITNLVGEVVFSRDGLKNINRRIKKYQSLRCE